MKKQIIFFIFFILFYSCQLNNFILNKTIPMVNGIQDSILSESDIELAKNSTASLIKIAEGIVKTNPKNTYFAGKLVMLYSVYGFLFYNDFNKQKHFYKKAKLYSEKYLRFLKINNKILFEKKLKNINKKNFELVLWYTFSYSMLIFNSLDNINLLSGLWKIEYLLKHLIIKNKNYLYGLPLNLISVYYGGRTEALGGNKSKSDYYYNESIKYALGKSIMPYYVRYRFISINNIDDKEFEQMYKKISDFEIHDTGELVLLNEVLKQKAKLFYKTKDDIF